MAFMAGANSIFDGDKLLTTANNDRYLYFSSLSPDNDTDLGDSGVVVSIGIIWTSCSQQPTMTGTFFSLPYPLIMTRIWVIQGL